MTPLYALLGLVMRLTILPVVVFVAWRSLASAGLSMSGAGGSAAGQVPLGESPEAEYRRRQGEAIARRLDELGWSRRVFQRRLAERGLEVAPQAISQWVLGQTSPKDTSREVIADVLGVSYDYLFRPPT